VVVHPSEPILCLLASAPTNILRLLVGLLVVLARRLLGLALVLHRLVELCPHLGEGNALRALSSLHYL
jgi:hypothetical protein